MRSITAWRPARYLSQPADRKIGAGTPASRDQRDSGPQDYSALGPARGELIVRTTLLHLTAARAFRSAAGENLSTLCALHLPPRRR